MKLLSPFPVTGYSGPEYFCDRAKETEKIIGALQGKRNLTLFSLRRIGKTGLIQHVFNRLSKKKNMITIYVDLLHSQSLGDFINELSTAIIQAVPERSSFGKGFLKLIKSLRPVITYDQLTGQPQVSIEISNAREKENTLHTLIGFLNSRIENIVIALDEFQQISNYPETNTEAFLRGEIQKLKNTSFIFSGSQQHLLISMFTEAKRPFFASTQILKLEKIDPDVYAGFIMKKFARINNVSKSDIYKILDWTKCHTFYTQFVCNRLYLIVKEKGKVDINALFYEILKESEPVFFHYRDLLTAAQWQLLLAVAKKGRLYKPLAKDFIEKNKLGIPASVRRSLEALLSKEMVYKEVDTAGESFYEVYDVFLSRWLERL